MNYKTTQGERMDKDKLLFWILVSEGIISGIIMGILQIPFFIAAMVLFCGLMLTAMITYVITTWGYKRK